MSLKERLGPYFCLEDLNRQILSVKYPNGAMRGIVLIPDWAPLDEYAEQRVLLVNHIADKVEVAVPVNKEKLKTYLGVDKLGHFTARLYEKAMATVKINALLQDERQNYLTDYSNLPLNDISSSEGFSPSVDPTWESAFDTNNFVDNEDDSDIAINGSVDFTTTGLGINKSDRQDMNQCVYGKLNTQTSLMMFDTLWNNNELLEDVKDEVLELGLTLNKWGNIHINENYQSSESKIFAGGDVTDGKGTVAWSARSGRNAAFKIKEYLKESE